MRIAPWDYAGEFTTIHTVISLGTSSTKILSGNPARVLIVFSTQNAAATLFVKPETAITASEGLRLVNTGAFEKISFAEWGTIVCGEWYGRASGAGSPLGVQEVIFRPHKP